MILNAFSVLAAFAALVRLALGVIVVGAGAGALRRRWREPQGDAVEERYFLLASLGVALVAIGVASWPLLYLVLQSYVPEWPGVMCIEGVTRIGSGSVGAASVLPPLLRVIEVSKPAVVFACGLWVVFHVAARRGGTGGHALLALLACGALATADAAMELAYLGIPKREVFLASGCCSVGAASTGHSTAGGGGSTTAVSAALWTVGIALVAALTAGARRLGGAPSGPRWLALAFLLAAASVPIGVAFLGAVAAPVFLRLPHHDCPYCLIAGAPDSLLGIALYTGGAMAVAWAAAAWWLAPAATGRDLTVPLLRWARFGYAGALLMTGVRMAIW